eukprot:SRR837773.8505.p1 GENE.SRR837773.8505~~SRR837773.8505.p1  ORF type:complete len:122 (+),score=21.68 SRR837773.8505:430-795(+)
MVEEAQLVAEEDRAAKEVADARISLQSFLLSIRPFVDGDVAGVSDDDRDRLHEALLDGKDFLASHTDADAAAFQEKRADLEQVCGTIVAQYGTSWSSGTATANTYVPDVDQDDDMEGHDEL